MIVSDIILNQGTYGKQDYDADDISIGISVLCISVPNIGDFKIGNVYNITGMGAMLYDESTSDYILGGGSDAVYGFCLTIDEYVRDPILGTTLCTQYKYITYDNLIRNFIYEIDAHNDPNLLLKLNRDKSIDEILK